MIGTYETRRDAISQPQCWIPKNNSCEPHFHSSIELTYVISGQMHGMVNGQQYVLGKDEFLLSPSYSLHQYVSDMGPSRSFVLTIPTDFVPSVKLLLSRNSFRSNHAKLQSGNALSRTLDALARFCAAKEDNPILLKGYTYTAAGLLIKELGLSPVSGGVNVDFSRDVLLYLDEHYLEQLSAEKTARHFGYSKSHFLHLFSDNFGFGLCEYLNILRCRHAALLMLNEDCPLLDAAMSSGYNSVRSFYRNFKDVFGQTPTKYIAAQKKVNSGSSH